MGITNQTWSFDELGLDFELEQLQEQHAALSAKHELLHEMLRERLEQKDFESETYKFLNKKLDEINAKLDTSWTIKGYVRNLKDGYQFNVPHRVGRYMKKFDLTVEQCQMFIEVHRKHLSAFERESEAWNKRTIGHVEKVVWSPEEDCLHVHYDDGEWWHYNRRGEWY